MSFTSGGLGGTTTITVSYNDFNHVVAVEVLEGTVEEDGIYVVSDNDIANQVNDKKAKQVVLSLPNLEKDSMKVEFSNSILNTLVLSKKDFIIQSEGATYTFTKKAVEKLSKEANGSLTITVGKVSGSEVSKAASDVYSIEFASGTGNNRVPINNFNEKIDIVLPVDDSKIIKTNKVSVIDLAANQLLKAKYNKGILEFTATNGGRFVVVYD